MNIKDLWFDLTHWKLTKTRMIHLAIGLTAVLVYEFIARPFYRPFIYANNIQDFHLADTIGNTLGTVATIFVFVGLIGERREQHQFLIKTIILSVALFELAHPLLGKPVDGWDLLATVITGGLCLLLYNVINPARQVAN